LPPAETDAAKVLPSSAVTDDDFVLPVRRDVIDDAVDDVVEDDAVVVEGDDSVDIEKLLEKVFAENDKRKSETKFLSDDPLADFKPEMPKIPEVPDLPEHPVLMSYSLTSVDQVSIL